MPRSSKANAQRNLDHRIDFKLTLLGHINFLDTLSALIGCDVFSSLTYTNSNMREILFLDGRSVSPCDVIARPGPGRRKMHLTSFQFLTECHGIHIR